METSRERKIRFLYGDSFEAPLAINDIMGMYRKFGFDWFTDEQLDDIVRERISNYRFQQKINRRNRRYHEREA